MIKEKDSEVAIIVTTLAHNNDDGIMRASNMFEALHSWNRGFELSIRDVHIHVADDGSTLPGYPQDHIAIDPYFHICHSRQESRGVGASLNAGIAHHPDTNLFAYFVDDWKLEQEFDFEPWLQLLERDPSIGAVRLGPPHPDISGEVVYDSHPSVMPDGLWYLRLHRHHYAYSMRPYLWHRRFSDYYGLFVEDVSAVESERLMNDQFMEHWNGPEIIYAMPSSFRHLDGPEFGLRVVKQ